MPTTPARDAELEAMRQRFPKPTGLAAAYQAVAIVATNAFLLYLVVTRQSSPLAIAAFALLEILLLSGIANATLLGVPKAARVGDPGVGIGRRLVIIVLGLTWLGGIYWLSLGAEIARVQPLLQSDGLLAVFAQLNIAFPLLLSGAFALAGSLADRARWRRRGGLFVSGLAMSAAPKFLTLIVAPIPALLVSDSVAKTEPASAALYWSFVYLGIKCGAELLLFAWQWRGMPEAQPRRAPAR